MTNGWMCDDCGRIYQDGSAVAWPVNAGDPSCHHKTLRRTWIRRGE